MSKIPWEQQRDKYSKRETPKGPEQYRTDQDHVPSTKEILFVPEEQSAGNKRQRQETVIEKGKGTREREGMFAPERQRTAFRERGDRSGL